MSRTGNRPDSDRDDVDPNAVTMQIPAFVMPPQPARPSPQPDPIPVAPAASPAFATPAPAPYGSAPAAAVPYVHRFGNVPFYLLARLLAYALDLIAVAFVIATFAFHATEAGTIAFAGRDASGFATLALVSLGAAFAFAYLCEALFGTTLGKAFFALHVRRRDGGHVDGARVFVRTLLRPLDLIAIGPLVALVTPRHQRLGDFAAGTVVARSRIGAFATLLALLAFAGIGYAQITYGGGLTSAIGVAAETSDYAPGLLAGVAATFGVPASRDTRPAPQGAASAAPAPLPSAAGLP